MHDSVIETLYTLTEDLLSYVSRILARRSARGLECRLAVDSKLLEGSERYHHVWTEPALHYKVLYLNVA
jgi:hypothetical protein